MTEEEKQELHGSDEFEREPVPEKAQLSFKSFIGMYAGEHCAGTELMIGPLFVVAGVSAFDVVVGLIVGNLLAVLSWMFDIMETNPDNSPVEIPLKEVFHLG